MAEATMGMTQQAFGENKDNSVAQFFKKPTKDEKLSQEKGYPVFVEENFVRIMTPGRHGKTERPVYVGDSERWPGAWTAFQSEKDQDIEGFLLENWPQMDRGLATTLSHQHIYTVEQLAELPDNLCQKFMGGYDLRQKARDFMQVIDGTVNESKLQAELRSRDVEIESLHESLAELRATLDEKPKAKKAKAKG